MVHMWSVAFAWLVTGAEPDCQEDLSLLQIQHKDAAPCAPVACPYKIPKDAALLVIDMQNDFINGSLTVTGGADIIPLINSLSNCDWAMKAFTQDFHPANHASFASTSVDGVGIFGFENLSYGNVENGNPYLCGKKYVDAGIWGDSAQETCSTQTMLEQQLWPDHCVQGTWGQQFDASVIVDSDAVVAKKGYSAVVDSYGVFFNNLGIGESNLEELFTSTGIKEVYLVGLAYDYCVKNSALQSSGYFKTTVLIDGTRAVDPSAIDSVTQELEAGGVTVIESTEALN